MTTKTETADTPSLKLKRFQSDGHDLLLITDKKHHLYDPRAEGGPLDETLPVRMERNGWQPGSTIVVNEETTKDDDGVEIQTHPIVDGKQRYKSLLIVNAKRAAKGSPLLMADVVVMPKEARADTPQGHYLQFMVLFQANQGATKEDPLHEAMKAKRLIQLAKEAGIKEKQAMADATVILGCSLDALKNRLHALDAIPEARKAYKENTISFSDLVTIGTKPTEKQAKALESTPKRDPERKRRPKTTRKPGDRVQGKGKVRPTAKVIERYLEAMGDGHKGAIFMKFCGGLVSEATFQKKTGIKPA